MGGSCVLVLFVDTTPDIAAQQHRMLTELAELGLAFARGLEARVAAVQSLDEAQALALAFHRISRSVRLCLALQSRLQRERREGVRQDRILNDRLVETRKAQVRAVLTRAAYDEHEADDAEALLDELEERLDEEALYEDFPEGPVEACIERIRAWLGLPPQDPANDAAAPTAPRIARSG